MRLSKKHKKGYSVAFAMFKVQVNGHNMLSRVFWTWGILPWFSQNWRFHTQSQGVEANSCVGVSLNFISFLSMCLFLAYTLGTTPFYKWGTGRNISRLLPQIRGAELHHRLHDVSQMFAWCALKNFLYRGTPCFWKAGSSVTLYLQSDHFC